MARPHGSTQETKGLLHAMHIDTQAGTYQQLRASNATRICCRHCGVPILPDNLARHESLHEDD